MTRTKEKHSQRELHKKKRETKQNGCLCSIVGGRGAQMAHQELPPIATYTLPPLQDKAKKKMFVRQ